MDKEIARIIYANDSFEVWKWNDRFKDWFLVRYFMTSAEAIDFAEDRYHQVGVFL